MRKRKTHKWVSWRLSLDWKVHRFLESQEPKTDPMISRCGDHRKGPGQPGDNLRVLCGRARLSQAPLRVTSDQVTSEVLTWTTGAHLLCSSTLASDSASYKIQPHGPPASFSHSRSSHPPQRLCTNLLSVWNALCQIFASLS